MFHFVASIDNAIAPAREAVQLERVRFDAELVIESDYIGDPSPATDIAWHTLLES